MPSTTWMRRAARALRDLVSRAHLRAEPLPRLPFGIAFAASLVALAAALEHTPKADERTVALTEIASGIQEDAEGVEYFEEEAEVEIVEYGFSEVTVGDRPWIMVGAVIRNPNDAPLSVGALSITAETEQGYPVRLEDFYMGSIPPETSVSVGYVANAGTQMGDERIAVADLRLEALEPSYVYSNSEEDGTQVSGMPEATLLETEPLLSPDGYRLHYRLDAAEAGEAQMSVLFRDEAGRLIGGFIASADPFGFDGAVGVMAVYLPVPEGESFQYIDIAEAWIPEGADLDRIEVGPSS